MPTIKVCNMSRQVGDRDGYIALTIEKKAPFIQLHKKQGIEGLAEDVAKLHAAGVKVNFFGAQDRELILKLAQAGVDYILTDDLDLCQQVLKEYPAEAK